MVMSQELAKLCMLLNQDKSSEISEVNSLKFLKVFTHYKKLIKEIINRVAEISVYTKIYKIKNNIVIIGRNGSGKSNFARELNSMLSEEMSIISAQRLLYYNPPTQISLKNNYFNIIREFQSESKLSKDENYHDLVLNDFTNLLLALFEEKRMNVYRYYSGSHKTQSVIDKTIDIWQEICSDKKMVHSLDFELVVHSGNGDTYEFNLLSDGEKAIFYYIGHTLLAKKDGYILIDEPENHLHLSSCIKLWDILERKRDDCKFIYITHNLEFATSRKNKTLVWNEKYQPPFDWEFEIIEENQGLPEKFLIEMLGSRKKILFCEGKERKSIDHTVYKSLFPEYHVIPVDGHKEVITYVRASLKNDHLAHFKIIGIIDGDFISSSMKKAYESDNIFTLPFNEIENLIFSETILKLIIKKFHCNKLMGGDVLNRFKEEFFNEIIKNKESLSLEYTRHKLNEHISSHSLTTKSSSTISDLQSEVDNYFSSKKINEIYESYHDKLVELVREKDFEELMKINNLKGRLIGIAQKYVTNDYVRKVEILFEEIDPEQLLSIRELLGDFYSNIHNSE